MSSITTACSSGLIEPAATALRDGVSSSNSWSATASLFRTQRVRPLPKIKGMLLAEPLTQERDGQISGRTGGSGNPGNPRRRQQERSRFRDGFYFRIKGILLAEPLTQEGDGQTSGRTGGSGNPGNPRRRQQERSRFGDGFYFRC
ncbi:uncharacterized protein LOC144761249 [Lissotriton helveticus]